MSVKSSAEIFFFIHVLQTLVSHYVLQISVFGFNFAI